MGCLCVQPYCLCNALMGCLEHGVRGSSHVCMAKLFLFTDVMGMLDPGVRGSSRARMGCLCVWPSCSFNGFDGSPGAWRALFFTSTDGVLALGGQAVAHIFDGLHGAWRAWFFTSTDGLPVCGQCVVLHEH